jgi:hypothetical protein
LRARQGYLDFLDLRVLQVRLELLDRQVRLVRQVHRASMVRLAWLVILDLLGPSVLLELLVLEENLEQLEPLGLLATLDPWDSPEL